MLKIICGHPKYTKCNMQNLVIHDLMNRHIIILVRLSDDVSIYVISSSGLSTVSSKCQRINNEIRTFVDFQKPLS